MKIEIFFASHTLKAHESAWLADYLRRMGTRNAVRLTRIKEKARSTPSATAEATWKELEKKIPPKSFRVMLDPEVAAVTTEEFGRLLERSERSGKSPVAFVLGGSYGLPSTALDSADATISLSRLTLPHRLALLVLVEQIYRTLTRRAGSPYHHGD